MKPRYIYCSLLVLALTRTLAQAQPANKHFIAGRSSGVFHMTSCPNAPDSTAGRDSLVYFASPTEAARAGYRPCRGCLGGKPEALKDSSTHPGFMASVEAGPDLWMLGIQWKMLATETSSIYLGLAGGTGIGAKNEPPGADLNSPAYSWFQPDDAWKTPDVVSRIAYVGVTLDDCFSTGFMLGVGGGIVINEIFSTWQSPGNQSVWHKTNGQKAGSYLRVGIGYLLPGTPAFTASMLTTGSFLVGIRFAL